MGIYTLEFLTIFLVFSLVSIKEKVTKKVNIILLSLISLAVYFTIKITLINTDINNDAGIISSIIISATLLSLIYFTNNMKKFSKVLLISIIYLIISIGYFYLNNAEYRESIVEGLFRISFYFIDIIFYCVITFISFRLYQKSGKIT